jgi:hypothetical protein
MNDDIEHAIRRLRDPAGRAWYRERCARWPSEQRELHVVVAASGLAVKPVYAPADEVRPDVWLHLVPLDYDRDGFRASYDVAIRGSIIANVVTIDYSATVANTAPGGQAPTCRVTSTAPLVAAHAAIETTVVPALAARGWRRIGLAEQDELVDGFGRAINVLERDINGSLDDGEPLPPPDRGHLAGYIERLARDYPTADAIRAVAATTPAWHAELGDLLGPHAVPIAPARYPSASWTVGFGDSRAGAFEARFVTDVHVSKLAPVWYYTDRFALAHANPDATTPELAGWMVDEIGYLAAQTELVTTVRGVLARHGIHELDDADLRMPMPSPYGGVAMLGELLFRDTLRALPSAPRVEVEGVDRNLQPRIEHLR